MSENRKKENRECKNSVFVDLFYENESAAENDIAEHPSTVNENMPLRSLLYIGRAFEQIVPVKDRYRRKKVLLSKPEIYVFYNGRENYAKEKLLYLSDSYIIKDEEPMLELKVKVINSNPSQKHEVLEKCPVLKDYSVFMEARS